MQSIWLSLLWKEWREYRWKLAVLSVAILVPPFLFTAWGTVNTLDFFVRYLLVTLLGYGFLAGMFLGMGVAARENGVGTIPFLQSLPIPMWKAATAKLLVASVTAATPIVLLIAVSYGCFSAGFFYVEDMNQISAWRNVDPAVPGTVANWFIGCLLAAVVGTLSLLWWAAALGVNRSDEIRAGAIGFLGIVAIWVSLGYLLNLSDKHRLPSVERGLAVAASAAPAGPAWWQIYAQSSESRSPYVPGLPAFGFSYPVIGLLGHAGVLGWFLFRFGRVSPKTGRGDELLSKTVTTGNLKAPFKSQLTAIAWKQMRETGPLAVLALPAILAISGLIMWTAPDERLNFSQNFLQVGAIMSFFVVLVAGIGLYLDELKPGLNHFWRSRPNDFRLWFGIKFASGLLVLVTVLGIPLFLAGWSQWSESYNHEWKELWGGTLFGAWLFVITYSLAMTFQCLVRQPIYAVVLTLTAMWLGAYLDSLLFNSASHWSFFVAAMILALVVVVALAWKTVKHDWGWNR